MMTTIPSANRYRRRHPCPICGGGDDMPRGRGERCHGFDSTDGTHAHCSSDAHAGRLQPEANGTYAHRLTGDCRCGVEHAPADTSHTNTPIEPRSIVATFDYRDAGALVYQEVKYSPKGFSQRRPDPDRPGEWLYNLTGVQRILYGRDELRAADPAAIVYVPEGPKDVENVRKLGKVATTNPEGAEKWRDHFSEDLRGRCVVLLMDNDDAGRKHVEKVARSLHGIAASVQILRLPDLPDGGDVSDWISAGGTGGELDRLAAMAPHWHPSGPGGDSDDRQVNELRSTIDTLREENCRLRKQLAAQTAVHSKTMAAIHTPGLGPQEAISLVSTIHATASAISRGRHENGKVRVTLSDTVIDGQVRPGLASQVGANPKKMGAQLVTAHERGILVRDLRSAGHRKSALYLGLPDYRASDPNQDQAILDAQLAALDRIVHVTADEKAKRGAGSRPRQCPDHPYADVIHRRRDEWFCADCSQVIDIEQTSHRLKPRPSTDEPEQESAHGVTSSDPVEEGQDSTVETYLGVTSSNPVTRTDTRNEWCSEHGRDRITEHHWSRDMQAWICSWCEPLGGGV